MSLINTFSNVRLSIDPMNAKQLFAFLFIVFSTYPAFACDCTLTHIPINPIEPTRNNIFVGKAATLELQFHNESTKQVVDVFPEPPLTIRHSASGTSCDINGGTWVRQSVYLSTDEKILVVQEFSGSNDQLVFYETATCKKRSEVDISGARWMIASNQISIGRQCSRDDITSCGSIKQLDLDRRCSPMRTNTKKITLRVKHAQP